MFQLLISLIGAVAPIDGAANWGGLPFLQGDLSSDHADRSMLGVTYLRRHKGVCHLKELPEKERHTLACKRGMAPDIRGERLVATKGVDIEMAPLDEDHVRAKITWSEQDVGGGKLVVEVTVKNMKTRPKTDDQLRSDARALAVRFARAFADTIEN